MKLKPETQLAAMLAHELENEFKLRKGLDQALNEMDEAVQEDFRMAILMRFEAVLSPVFNNND